MLDLRSIREMVFGKLFSKFRISKPQRKATNDNFPSRNQAFIESPLLKINDNIRTSDEIKKALDRIEKSIDKEGPSSKLILRKSDLLLRKEKFNQARQLLIGIQNDKKDPSTSKKARKLLGSINHLQQQAGIKKNKKLADDLQLIAKKYNFHLKNLPSAQDQSFNLDVSQIVRKESQRARTAELPMLSYELINQALDAGQESPWLLLGKALSLDMMGQQGEALKILEELKKNNKGEKINESIDAAVKNAQKNTKNYRQHIFNVYLANHIKAIGENQKINTEFVPNVETINAQSKVKSLIFKEALNIITENPEKSLILLNAILDYSPGDGAALQLKCEALVALKQSEKAIQIWVRLAQFNNKELAQAASESFSKFLTKKAKRISSSRSPQEAITFYIKEHFKHHFTPSITKGIKSILEQIEPQDEDFYDPDLRQHQLQLQFNALLIEYLETQLRERGRLDPGAAAQKPGAIRKTGPKAG